jgi:ankyrin repeat protein
VSNVAADRNNSDVIKYLVVHGADINKPNFYGNTPFHFFVYNEPDIETAKFLLENGADADKLDNSGRTVAGRAEHEGNIDVAKYIESYEPMPTKGVMNG